MPVENELQIIEQETNDLVTQVMSGAPVEVTSQASYGRAGDVVKMLERHSKALEEKRLEYTKPLDDTKKRIKADFDRMREPIDQKASDLRRKMILWQTAEQLRLDAKQKEIDDAAMANAKANNISEVVVPIVNEQAKTVRGAMTTSSVKKVWKWEVTDGTQIPCEFHIVDGSRITQAVRDGRRTIPGVHIYEDSSLSIR